MGVGMVVPMHMAVVVVVVVAGRMTMGVIVVVGMGVGRGGNHARTLYYNITDVHGPAQGLPRRAIPHTKKAAAHATALFIFVIPGRRSRTRND